LETPEQAAEEQTKNYIDEQFRSFARSNIPVARLPAFEQQRFIFRVLSVVLLELLAVLLLTLSFCEWGLLGALPYEHPWIVGIGLFVIFVLHIGYLVCRNPNMYKNTHYIFIFMFVLATTLVLTVFNSF
jgi:hypothetical protein